MAKNAERVVRARARLYEAIEETRGFTRGTQDLQKAIKLVRKAESDLIAVAFDEATD